MPSKSIDELTMNKPQTNTANPKYEPTSQERIPIPRVRAQKSASPAPRLDDPITKKQGATVSRDHQDKAIGCAPSREATGTADKNFLVGLLGGSIDEDRLSFPTSVLKGMKPRDQIEAMLLTQMAAVHKAITRFTQQLAGAENIQQLDFAERGLNRLARTFAAQTEAFKRYRSGGEQNVTVQNVAIVGNVTQAPREAAPNEAAASPPALADSRNQAMTILDKPAPTRVRLERLGRVAA